MAPISAGTTTAGGIRARRAGTAVAASFWLAAALPSPALAHPHIFVDTGMQLVFDEDGRLAALRVIWVYDELYSLLILDDRGLDQDYTGILTPEEIEVLSGFDMNWQDGYEGDVYPAQAGLSLPLSGPVDWTADFREGRIITTHLRVFEPRIDMHRGPVAIEAYDPTYYTAYGFAVAPMVVGREDCAAEVFEPDLRSANEALNVALREFSGDALGAGEDDFPAVGALFAEEVRLTCDAPS